MATHPAIVRSGSQGRTGGSVRVPGFLSVAAVKPVRGCLVWCAWTGKFFALVNSQTYQLRIEHLEWSVSEWANGSSKWLDRELFGSRTAHPDRRRRRTAPLSAREGPKLHGPSGSFGEPPGRMIHPADVGEPSRCHRVRTASAPGHT